MVSRSLIPVKAANAPEMPARPVSGHIEGPASIVSLRESSITTLAAHGGLDADQVAAAWRFRRAWLELVGLRRPSLLFERIDNSRSPDACVEREDEARQELKRCREILGAYGFDLLVKVCAEGYHVKDLFQTRRQQDTASDMLKIHLDSLKETKRG